MNALYLETLAGRCAPALQNPDHQVVVEAIQERIASKNVAQFSMEFPSNFQEMRRFTL